MKLDPVLEDMSSGWKQSTSKLRSQVSLVLTDSFFKLEKRKGFLGLRRIM